MDLSKTVGGGGGGRVRSPLPEARPVNMNV